MNDDAAIAFTADEAVAVQRSLRKSLGLDAETFPVPRFIAMISDEIESIRAAGGTDDDIAATVKAETGRDLDVADIAKYYAPPEARGWGDG